jgi:hypothetical protein
MTSQGVTREQTGAAVGGVGGGTGFAGIAELLGGTHTAPGVTLLYLSPSITFVVGLLLFAIQDRAAQYFEDKQVRRATNKLLATINSASASEDAKTRARRKLELLEESVTDAELKRVGVYVDLAPQPPAPAPAPGIPGDPAPQDAAGAA